MPDILQARKMLQVAQRDAIALKGMLDEEVTDDAIFGFHVQQAVEKGLKAWLSCRDIPYPKIHDLAALLDVLRHDGENIPPLWESFVSFTEFAVQFRYEPEFTWRAPKTRAKILEDVFFALAHVEEIVRTT